MARTKNRPGRLVAAARASAEKKSTHFQRKIDLSPRMAALHEQAIDWVMENYDPDECNDFEWSRAIVAKYSALIVQECLLQCEAAQDDLSRGANITGASAALLCAQSISQSLGVGGVAGAFLSIPQAR